MPISSSSGGSSSVALAKTGTIVAYGGTSAPSEWLLCDGSAVSRATYDLLFGVIGTLYGAGDASTTFNLPNLKGRVPVGVDATITDFNARGKTGGEKTHVLTLAEMPAHTHGITSWDDTGSSSLGPVTQGQSAIADMQTTSKGSDAEHENMPPYQTAHYIIKT